MRCQESLVPRSAFTIQVGPLGLEEATMGRKIDT
jgi:hypothetical protein